MDNFSRNNPLSIGLSFQMPAGQHLFSQESAPPDSVPQSAIMPLPRLSPASFSLKTSKPAKFLRTLFGCILLCLVIPSINGCAYHPQTSIVYGASGKQYTAPALCQALVECKNSNESKCYYEDETQTDSTGSRDTFYCKEVKQNES